MNEQKNKCPSVPTELELPPGDGKSRVLLLAIRCLHCGSQELQPWIPH